MHTSCLRRNWREFDTDSSLRLDLYSWASSTSCSTTANTALGSIMSSTRVISRSIRQWRVAAAVSASRRSSCRAFDGSSTDRDISGRPADRASCRSMTGRHFAPTRTRWELEDLNSSLSFKVLTDVHWQLVVHLRRHFSRAGLFFHSAALASVPVYARLRQSRRRQRCRMGRFSRTSSQ